MKKVVAAIVVLGLLGVGVYFFLQIFRTSYPERLFPKETTAYLLVHNTKEIGKLFEKTRLWQEMDKSPRKEIYRRQVDRAMSSLESMTGADFKPLFAQFTRDIALGFFPLQGTSSGAAIVAYVDSESDVRKFMEQKLDPSLKRRMPDLNKASVNYKGITYYAYHSQRFSSKASPCYFIADHHLVIAFSEPGITTLLDVKNNNVEPLKKSSLLKEAKSEIGYKQGILLFVDINRVLTQVKAAISPDKQKFWNAAIRILGLDSLRSFSYRIGVRDEGFEEVGFVSIDKEKKGLLKIYMQQPSRKLEGIAAIPPDGKVASAGTIADAAKMWDEINAQLHDLLTQDQYNRWQGALGALRGFFDFDIRRDLLEPIGDQFGFAYEAPSAGEPDLTKLKYLIAAQLRNPDQMSRTMKRLLELGSMRGVKKEETYHGKKVQMIQFQLGSFSVSPAFYIDHSWLYFATDYSFLKKSIDAQSNGKAVDSTQDYQKVTLGFPSKLNGISYTNVPEYLRMYAGILNRQADRSDARWIREYGVSDELGALSKALFGAASYTQIEDDGIYGYSFGSIPRSVLTVPPLLANLPEILTKYYRRS